MLIWKLKEKNSILDRELNPGLQLYALALHHWAIQDKHWAMTELISYTGCLYNKENLERQETNKNGRGTERHLRKTYESVVRLAGDRRQDIERWNEMKMNILAGLFETRLVLLRLQTNDPVTR